MWLLNPGCEKTVQAAWDSTVGLDLNNGISARVEKCGTDLLWWNRNVFGNVRQELLKKKELLNRAKTKA